MTTDSVNVRYVVNVLPNFFEVMASGYYVEEFANPKGYFKSIDDAIKWIEQSVSIARIKRRKYGISIFFQFLLRRRGLHYVQSVISTGSCLTRREFEIHRCV